jgi:hypothetical protein
MSPSRPEKDQPAPPNTDTPDFPKACPNCQDVLVRCVEARPRSVPWTLAAIAGVWLAFIAILSLLLVSDTAAERFAGIAAITLVVLWFARTRYRAMVEAREAERRYFCRRCGGYFEAKDVETKKSEPER